MILKGSIPVSSNEERVYKKEGFKLFNMLDNTSTSMLNSITGNIKSKAVDFISEKVKNKIKFSMGIEACYWNYFEDFNRPIVHALNQYLYNINQAKYINHCTDKLGLRNYKNKKRDSVPNLSLGTEYIVKLDKDSLTYVYIRILNKTTDHDDLSIVYMYFFGKKCYKYKVMLDEFILKGISSTKDDVLEITEYTEDTNNTFYTIPKKTSKTVFLEQEIIEDTVDIIKRWASAKDFFKEREMSHKLGILLYGVPGTGKTTFSKYIASELDANIFIPNKSHIAESMRVMQQRALNINTDRPTIVLLEDFDYIFTTRDEEDKNNKKNQDDLLQYLDGMRSVDNMIFIATTNKTIDETDDEDHKDVAKLDKALIRDGRFDIKIPMNGISKELAHKMIDSFNLKNPSEAIAFVDNQDDDKLIIPATLQKIILRQQYKEFILPTKKSGRNK